MYIYICHIICFDCMCVYISINPDNSNGMKRKWTSAVIINFIILLRTVFTYESILLKLIDSFSEHASKKEFFVSFFVCSLFHSFIYVQFLHKTDGITPHYVDLMRIDINENHSYFSIDYYI